MKSINKIMVILIGTLFLNGCNTDNKLEIEINDCQSSVLSILSSGYSKVMSDHITIKSDMPEAEKHKLSREICINKNSMYFV